MSIQRNIQNYLEDAIINCLTCILIFLLLHDTIFSACISIFSLKENETILASCVGDIVGIPFLLYWIKKYTNTKKEITKSKTVTSLYFFILAIGASIALNGILILSGITKLFANDYEQTTNQLYGGTLVITILFSAIIAPITEELLYRKIIYSKIKESSQRFIVASIASSFLFAIAHMAIVQGIYGFFVGMILCYCYEIGNGVKTSIFVHMVMNLTSIIGTQFLYTMSPNVQNLFWLVGSIVGTCIVIVFFIITRNIYNKK